MKQPTWEPAEGALVTWLNSNRLALPVDMWTIALLGSTVLRYSGGDAPITVAGLTWGLGPGLQRGQRRQTIGVSVDTLSLKVLADSDVLVGGVPFLQALAKGVFSGATVKLERAFLDTAGVCRGVVPDFYGRVGAISVGRSGATVEVRSHAELLDVMIPGDVYQPGCRNTVFDPQCGLSSTAFTVTGAASTAGDATRRVIASTSAATIAKPATWADLGVLKFTTGPNFNISRTVRSHALLAGTATIVVVYPFPFPISAGDAFTLRAGCNKSKDGDCATKFSNLAGFRGEPYIPAPETVT